MADPKIKSDVVIKSGGKYVQLVRVCNDSNQRQKLLVTTWPWYELAATKNPNDRVSQTIELAKGECTTVRFESTRKPLQFYTDLYQWKAEGNHQGRRYQYNVTIVRILDLDAILEAFRRGARRIFRSFAFYYPYPMGLEPAGKQRQFVVRGVDGLPQGWSVSRVCPAIGELVVRRPDSKDEPLLLELQIEKDDPELSRIDVRIDAGLVRSARRALHQVPVGFSAVRKRAPTVLRSVHCRRDPAYPHLAFDVEVEDEQGLLESPELLYSTDRGKSWRREDMQLREAMDFGDLGLARATFEAWVPLPSMKSTALAAIILRDQLGNEFHSRIERWPRRAGA